MKNLKPLIFSAHSELKATHSTIKKSHLYEAFASFCGFKSYAAFQAATVIRVDDVELAKRQCLERMQGIGFDVGNALLICQSMENVWEQYDTISLDDIYSFYSEPSFEKEYLEKRILETLKSLIVSGDSEAILMGVVFTAQILAEYEENPDNRSGEYWYKKLLANEELSSMHREVAEEYQHILSYQEFFEFLRLELANNSVITLPSPSIIKPICQQFDDGIMRRWSQYFKSECFEVLEAFEFFNYYKEPTNAPLPEKLVLDWQKAQAMIDPNRWTIAGIIEGSTSNKEKWFWYYWGLEHSIDVTQDNLYAINADTGAEYDDYGPMDVAGDEGIKLPRISAKDKSRSQNLSQQLLGK
ncbi:hypothetical protein QX776_07430 [Alteromonadaceae bacterium BrNp21-10]|nr:hypothetical protein [Alteromonadaceae bacterium BrNp21-10]